MTYLWSVYESGLLAAFDNNPTQKGHIGVKYEDILSVGSTRSRSASSQFYFSPGRLYLQADPPLLLARWPSADP